MRTIGIIQARMSSSRLPAKIMMDIEGKPALQRIIERLSLSKTLDDIVIATSTEKSDDSVENFCKKNKIKYYRGDLDNVLKRFLNCAQLFKADSIVRLTADNTLIDPLIIDEAVTMYKNSNLDYLYYKEKLPLGMAVEVFNFFSLKKSYEEAINSECLEHVTPYIYMNPSEFKILKFCNQDENDYSSLRFTMDTPSDLEFVRKIYNYFGSINFSYKEIICFLEEYPEIITINNDVPHKMITYQGGRM